MLKIFQIGALLFCSWIDRKLRAHDLKFLQFLGQMSPWVQCMPKSRAHELKLWAQEPMSFVIIPKKDPKKLTYHLLAGIRVTEGVCPFWLQTETNYNECRFMYVDIVPSLISKGHRNAMDTSLSASCREFVNMATTVNKSVARQTDQASLFFVQMLLSQTLLQVNRSRWMRGFCCSAT